MLQGSQMKLELKINMAPPGVLGAIKVRIWFQRGVGRGRVAEDREAGGRVGGEGDGGGAAAAEANVTHVRHIGPGSGSHE